jgi:hypothetical protein
MTCNTYEQLVSSLERAKGLEVTTHDGYHHIPALGRRVSAHDLEVDRHVVFDDIVAGATAGGKDEPSNDAALLDDPRRQCGDILLTILIPDK